MATHHDLDVKPFSEKVLYLMSRSWWVLLMIALKRGRRIKMRMGII